MFGTREILIFLKRDTLELYSADSEGTLGRLEFPPDVYRAEEVLSEDKFTKMVADFVGKVAQGAKKTTIAIAEEAVFFKELKRGSVKDPKAEAQSFFAEVPFDPAHLAQKIINKGDMVVFLATNKKVFDSVISAVRGLGIETDAVVPANLFIASGASILTKDQVKRLLEKDDRTKEANLMGPLEPKPAKAKEAGTKEDSAVEAEAENENNQVDAGNQGDALSQKPKPNYKLIAAIFIFVLLFSALGFMVYKNTNLLDRFLPKGLKKVNTVVVSNPTPVATSSPEASSSPTVGANLSAKINVLNGTGKAGQATVAKDKLTEAGFLSVETGNSQTQGLTVTTVEFKDNIGSQTKIKIIDILAAIFSDVKTKTMPAGGDFDVVITTGTQK